MGQRDCLSEDEALAHVAGSTGPGAAADVQEHLDGCVACRVLVAEAARALTGEHGRTVPGAPLTLGIGQLVATRYRILRFVARGGMGEVYEAHDSVLGETVALKTLASTSLDSPQAMNRLLSEVRLARQVTHPNVCRIFEMGFHRVPDASGQGSGESIPFLTMQYLHGENLQQKIRREGALPTDTVAAILRQIVAGLAAIHAAGIVHRDIKPQNIMLLEGPDLRVVLTDFGLARALAPGAGSGTTGRFVVGTHEYMSPEQLESRSPTPAFDVYALGVVIFEMLTGRYPFAGLTVLQRVLAAPPRPTQARPGLDPAWDRVVAGCLALDPQHRFARVERILDTAPAERRPAPVRSRARLLAAAALLGVLVAVPLLALRLHHSAARVRLSPRPVHRVFLASGCSEEMVRVADRFCIDRFEASVVEDVQERPLSPFYPPDPELAREIHDTWSARLRRVPSDGRVLPDLPTWHATDGWRPRAVSRHGTIPQGYLNQPLAAEACRNAGKRLCSAEEWRTACQGEGQTLFPYGPVYQDGACNIARPVHPALLLYGTTSSQLNDPRLNHLGFQGKPLLMTTGAAAACQSRWGSDAVYDMVGNLDEWIDDPAGTFVGGFYSRDTRDGCLSSIDRHDPDYLNYSLGFRCCDRLRGKAGVDGHPPGML